MYKRQTSDQRSSQGRLRPGQRSSVTITVDNMNGNGNTVLLIYSGNPSDTQGKKNVVHHLKVEKGNKATDWTQAPEDVNRTIKDATEYKAVTGTIDFNNLKTQQKIFYKDLQAANAPAGGNYWYYLDVEPGYDGRILQTAISDRDNITWVRTFVDSWSPWIKQADQRNVDDLHNQINGFKTEVTASVKNLGDRVTTEVNSVETRVNNKVDNLQVGGRNLLIGTGEEEASGKAYNFKSYQVSGGLQPNTTYTLSGWARVDQSSMNHRQNVFIDAYA